MKEFPKVYDPKQYEDGIYAQWEESGFFNPDVCIEKGVTDKKADPYSIVLPPPNVTGTLHMGHAAMLAIEDLMIRYHRMKGDRTLWIPGTDHAAIATQSKVESILYQEEKKTRHDLGREAFLERVNQFAKASHDTIVNQCKKMGSSLDWSREAFTLDEARNLAVRTAFKRMYDDELIYRGSRLVNWDPVMQSNVADDEIEWKEEQASFYYFQYGPFVIGTSRPETKFGDKYVVMHPGDERYHKYKHGEKITLEWINGSIIATIIKDEAVDPAFGSGVMTITPWHDAVDFDMAERHDLDKEQIIDLHGNLLPIAGEFTGLPILEARKKVVAKLEKKGLVVKVEEKYVHKVATNYRGGGLIEPQIREQWFVDVNKSFSVQRSAFSGVERGQKISLKQLMQVAVRGGAIKIIPERFDKQYFHWIDNLRDWCISRQIWYGHRIPVYYCKSVTPNAERRTPNCNGPIVSVGEIKECPHCGGVVEQDPDTLDTWFSSGLWTFSTLGWPDKTEDMKAYHPTAVLETGYDILFFWVARMILMTTYLLGEVPFHQVYLHGLVRDDKGRKMSKTLGNIIDPLDMIAKFGTDATRLSLVLGSTPGNDVKLSEEKVAGFRNFTNKLWNIARFMLLNIEEPKIDIVRPQPKTVADEWILYMLNENVLFLKKSLENLDLSLAGEKLRDFTWGTLADWYLEITKIEGDKSEILNYILNTILKLWHPYMPFVTEAIWKEVYGEQAFLMIERYPDGLIEAVPPDVGLFDEFIIKTISGIRALRSEYKIEPAKKIGVTIIAGRHADFFRNTVKIITSLARLESVEILEKGTRPTGMVGFVHRSIEVCVDLAEVVDTKKEKIRLQKEIDTVAPYVESLEKKLGNEQFTAHAPQAVVVAERGKLQDAKNKLAKLQEQLSTLQ